MTRAARVVKRQLAPAQGPQRRRPAQEALREAEERLRTVVAGAPVVLFATDRAGVFTLIEGKGLDALGIRPGEMVGRSISDVYRGRPDILGQMRRGLAGEECTSTTEIGGVVFQYRVTPFRGQGGEVAGIIGIATDITERKRAEALLAAEKQVLEMVAAGAPLPEVLDALARNVEAQSEGVLCSVLLLGRDGVHLLDGAGPSLPESYRQAVDGIAIGPSAGSCGTAAYRREAVIVTDVATDPLWADYRDLALSHGLRACWSRPILSSGGAVLGTFAMYYRQPRAPDQQSLELIERATHIACIAMERRRAEETLRDSEETYRELFENANDIVYTHDLTGRFTSINRAAEQVTGYSREEAANMNVAQIVAPEHLKQAMENIRRKVEEGGSTTYELEIIARDGRRIPLEVSTRLIYRDGNLVGIQGVARDITDRRRAGEALRESEEKYRDLVENINEVIYALDANGLVTYVSPAVEQIGGYSASEVVGRSFAEFIHPDDLPSLLESFQRTVAGNPEPSEYRVLTKSGEVHWVRSSSRPVYDGDRIIGLRAVLMDITERRKADETISYLAHHDALTGLPNRTLFMDRLALALAQARRSGQMLAVMSLDMDRFKVVNDTAGHSGGDQVLRSVAEQLTRLVREGDTAARLGGDQFALLLPAISSLEDATTVAERVRGDLRGPRLITGREFQLTTSIGIAIHPDDGQDAETMLRNADAAMYQAKEQGRNNYQLFAPSMNTRIVERLALETGLRRALERREFVVHYQPKANISSGRIVGAEALVRWQDAGRGLVLPGEFIPLAEQTGLIVPLGEWVLRTACAQNKAWQDAGFPPLRVSVNLSMRQFLQSDLVQMVARALHETGLAPRYLELEITESVASQQPDVAILVLRQLREMGVHISVDDFGTGYSSLNYLKRFPIHTLKIDRSFVNELTTDPNDVAIASAIITLAHSLNLDAIAEGVETEEQLAFLKQRHCDEFQGFLLAKALPAKALEKMLARESPLAASLRAQDGC